MLCANWAEVKGCIASLRPPEVDLLALRRAKVVCSNPPVAGRPEEAGGAGVLFSDTPRTQVQLPVLNFSNFLIVAMIEKDSRLTNPNPNLPRLK